MKSVRPLPNIIILGHRKGVNLMLTPFFIENSIPYLSEQAQ